MPGIQYRFSHERVWHPLEFEGTKIYVTQLREQIAKSCGLVKESNRRLTIRLLEAQSSKEFVDSDAVAVGTQVIAQRVPIHQIDAIKHTAKTHFTASELIRNENEKVKKPPLPQPYICDICHYILEKPVQLRCSGKCNGKTVCRAHVEEYLTLNPNRPRLSCPLDGPKAIMGTPYAIPNKRVVKMLQTMNFEAFEYPKRPQPTPCSAPSLGATEESITASPQITEKAAPIEIVLSYNPFVEYIGCLPFLTVDRFRRLKEKQISIKRRVATKLLDGVMMSRAGNTGSTASSSRISKRERREREIGDDLARHRRRSKSKDKKSKKRKKEKDKSSKAKRSRRAKRQEQEQTAVEEATDLNADSNATAGSNTAVSNNTDLPASAAVNAPATEDVAVDETKDTVPSQGEVSVAEL